jgi:hypothetical protein
MSSPLPRCLLPSRAAGVQRGGLSNDVRGAILVEFLIAFLPVFTFFLCLVQVGLLYAVRLAVEHAAVNTARAAAVVVGDDPSRYRNEMPLHRFQHRSGERYKALRRAALITLAPYILDGTLEGLRLEFPEPDRPGGDARTGNIEYAPMGDTSVSKVRVRVVADAACKIAIAGRIACSYWEILAGIKVPRTALNYPTRTLRAEAVFPYQGARYAYP